VDHGVEPLAGEPFPQRFAIADVGDDKSNGRIEVRAVTSGEVVERDDIITASAQRVDDVRAEEPGAAGHEHPHRSSYPLSLWTVVWTERWMAGTSERNLGKRRRPGGG